MFMVEPRDFDRIMSHKELRDGFQASLQNASVVVSPSLLCHPPLVVQLETNYSNYNQFGQSTHELVVALCYFSLFSNIGAVMCCFFLGFILNEIQTAEIMEKSRSEQVPEPSSAVKLTRRERMSARLGSAWNATATYWVLMFCVGTLTLPVLLLVYIFNQEKSKAVKGISVVLVVYLLHPPSLLLMGPPEMMQSMFRRQARRRERVEEEQTGTQPEEEVDPAKEEA
ncbi:hypothetical protein D9611_006221 [Ephemerocybe angulata]|uniref:Uncharacterized protein n=1 Tax=Ephemerocybe angulata TaxID=980116 RepID=A0A8H5C630_9AGAR|nr:hypothetical protein D9611_006221 [Tulosesus angulatus]